MLKMEDFPQRLLLLGSHVWLRYSLASMQFIWHLWQRIGPFTTGAILFGGGSWIFVRRNVIRR